MPFLRLPILCRKERCGFHEHPVAMSVFACELYQPPRSRVEWAYPKLIHYNHVMKGGHFPAWEEPQIFAEELRAGLRSLRF
jgi:pimeloyl-ACP methyl ester carboxylesterase